MDADQVRQKVLASDCEIAEEKRLANDTGTQFRLASGVIINVYDTGKLQYQGKNTSERDRIRTILEVDGDSTGPTGQNRQAFVVYGHDKTALTQLEAMLRRWGINPLILDQLPTEGTGKGLPGTQPSSRRPGVRPACDPPAAVATSTFAPWVET